MAGIKKLLILAVLVAIVWGTKVYFSAPKAPAYVLTTAQVTRGEIVSEVTATGSLNATHVVDIGSQVSGKIVEIYVDFNSPVKNGQLLAIIDPSVLQLSLNQAQANLALSQASVRSARASVDDAELQLKRNQELFKRKLVSRSEVDTCETNLSKARAQLDQGRADVLQKQAAVEQAKTNLDYTRITSPIDGIVTDRKVDVGQTVAASYQTPNLFSIAQDLSQMQIEAKVDEADIGGVQQGQNVTFHVDTFPDETFEGKVIQVRIAPQTTDNVVTYTVVIHVDNPNLKLKPGMTANVSIETARRENILCLPVASLRFTPPDELLATLSVDRAVVSRKRTLHDGLVWVGSDQAVERAVPVTIGISDSHLVELVKGDLREGDSLVVNAKSAAGNSQSRGMF